MTKGQGIPVPITIGHKTWPSMRDAARALNVPYHAIWYALDHGLLEERFSHLVEHLNEP